MELEGVIDEPQFLRHLVEMGRERFTGAMRLEREDVIKILYLQEGRIISASTNDPAESVDELLLRAKKVSREHVQQALSKRKLDETLGDALLSAGFISRKELRWARRHQIVAVLRSALDSEDWHYTIVPDYVSSRSSEGTHFEVEPLLIELVVTDPDRKRVDRRLEGGEVRLRKAPNFDEKYPGLGLNEDADRVAKLVDGNRTAAEIAAEAGGNGFMNLKLLAALHILGVLETRPKAQGQLEISFRKGSYDEAPLLPGIEPGRGREIASERELPVSGPSVQSWEVEPFPDIGSPELEIDSDQHETWDSPDPLLPGDFAAGGDEHEDSEVPLHLEDVRIDGVEEESINAVEGEWDVREEEGFEESHVERSPGYVDPFLTEGDGTPETDSDMGMMATGTGKKSRRSSSRRGLYLAVALALVAVAVLGLFLWPDIDQDEMGRPALSDPDLGVEAIPGTTTVTPVEESGEPPILVEEESGPDEPVAPPAVVSDEAPAEPERPQSGSEPGSLRDRHDQMAREYVSVAAAVPYTLQFEIVCETSSVSLALEHGGSSVWFVPIEYQGRPCYRVFWGRYQDEQSAAAAVDEIPRELRGGRPVVVRPGRVIQ